jgi:hypothetical protein
MPGGVNSPVRACKAVGTVPLFIDHAKGRGGVSGKYQHTDNLDELIASWRPETMLPRAFKDKRHMPEDIAGLSEGIK